VKVRSKNCSQNDWSHCNICLTEAKQATITVYPLESSVQIHDKKTVHCGLLWHDMKPLPVNPGKQAQLNPPSVLMQVAFAAHSSWSSAHSSSSANQMEKPRE